MAPAAVTVMLAAWMRTRPEMVSVVAIMRVSYVYTPADSDVGDARTVTPRMLVAAGESNELDEPVPVAVALDDDGVPVWLRLPVPMELLEPVLVALGEPVPVALDEPEPVPVALVTLPRDGDGVLLGEEAALICASVKPNGYRRTSRIQPRAYWPLAPLLSIVPKLPRMLNGTAAVSNPPPPLYTNWPSTWITTDPGPSRLYTAVKLCHASS